MRRAEHRFDNRKRYRQDDHPNQRQLTPAYVLEPVRSLLGGIDLDPCTEPDNPTAARRFYTPPADGCELPWVGSVFVNPPYGKAKDRWVARCITEAERGLRIVLLIPSHTETRASQRALERCSSVLFVKARLRFGLVRANGRHEAASHGSMLLGYGVDVSTLGIAGVSFGITKKPG